MQAHNRGEDRKGCRHTTEEGIGKDAGPQQRRGIGKDAGTQQRRGIGKDAGTQ